MSICTVDTDVVVLSAQCLNISELCMGCLWNWKELPVPPRSQDGTVTIQSASRTMVHGVVLGEFVRSDESTRQLQRES